MGRELSDAIIAASDRLDKIKFAGIDQNPGGIRDELFSLAYRARQLENTILPEGYFQTSGWKCEGSPTGHCLYTNGEYDTCIFCGHPDERK